MESTVAVLDQDHHRPATNMLVGSISNRKLHCCLILLVLFTLASLFVPLWFLWGENDDYQQIYDAKKRDFNNYSLKQLLSSVQEEEASADSNVCVAAINNRTNTITIIITIKSNDNITIITSNQTDHGMYPTELIIESVSTSDPAKPDIESNLIVLNDASTPNTRKSYTVTTRSRVDSSNNSNIQPTDMIIPMPSSASEQTAIPNSTASQPVNCAQSAIEKYISLANDTTSTINRETKTITMSITLNLSDYNNITFGDAANTGDDKQDSVQSTELTTVSSQPLEPIDLETTTSNSTISQHVNCTKFAIEKNLTLANEDFQCPASSWPNRCRSCPQLCIEQRMNCNRIWDCPDGSDEDQVNRCHDSRGAMKMIYHNIFNAAKTPMAGLGVKLKPDSCTWEQFNLEACPCFYNESSIVMCQHLRIVQLPKTFKPTVIKIKFDDNMITNIDNVQWPPSLVTLVLPENLITHMGPRAFEPAFNLKLLFLDQNRISYLDQDALFGLTNLTWLQLESNRLETFETSWLDHTPNLTKLYLSDNMIDLPDSTRFDRCCQNLRELLLDHNRISRIQAHWFSNMTSLGWLALNNNEISYIDDNSFDWNFSLFELNLSHNKIKSITSQIFARNLGIGKLHLSGNEFTTLPKDAFRELIRLESLNLTEIYFDKDGLDKETFAGLKLDFIYFAQFRYCHYASHVAVCQPVTDGLSSMNELLVFPILKAAVRIVALVCCLGNVFVFVWRSVSPNEHYTLSLFIRNLSVADLMMGIYLAAIGYKDHQFQQEGFKEHAIEWMSSSACTTIGFIAILSSELSVFVLIIITIERYRSIVSTEILEEEDQKRRARIYLLLAWILAVLIASYPLFGSNFYATNGLCLPLHIDQPYMPGWVYSAVVYLGINFAAVLTVIYLYAKMYTRIMRARQQVAPIGAMKREDAILATRFLFIVIIDCACWIPIVAFKIAALFQISIPSSINGWLVVFIIPINSALNPIVYTLAAPTSMRTAICRCFKRICDRFDRLTSRTTSGSRYSSHSSSSADSNATVSNVINALRIRRRTTGSTNSTTFDTADTITYHSKPSLESALIHYDCPTGNNSNDLHHESTLANHNHEHQKKEGALSVAVRPGTLTLSSMDLGCCTKPNNAAAAGNKQQQEPVNLVTDELDSLSSLSVRRRRRRQYAKTVAVATSTSASDSSSDINTTSATVGIGGAENKLNNNNQADYLSTYEDNNTDHSGMPLLADKATIACGVNTGSSSSRGGGGGSSSSGSSQEEVSPLMERRSLVRLVNNDIDTAPVMVHAHQQVQEHQHHRVLVQARPDDYSSAGLIKRLEPLQIRRLTVDSSTVLANNQHEPTQYPPINLQQRRFTEFVQVNNKDDEDGSGHVYDGINAVDTRTSLDFLVPIKQQEFGGSGCGTDSGRQSSRVSFSSKDSQTCLLSGHTDRS